MERSSAAVALQPLPRMAGTLRIEMHTEVSELHVAWSELERRCGEVNIFQTADWCRAWIEAAQAEGEAESPRIVAIWRGDRLVLLWPLAVRRLSVFRILHTLAEPATQYGDVLIDEDEDAAMLLAMAWTEIRSWRDIDAVELRRVRNASPLALLPALAPHLVERSRASAPILDFRHLGPKAVDGQRTSRTRNALRRHERLLGELGPVSFEIVTSPEQQCAALREAFALKRQWQKEKSITSSGYAHHASERSLLSLAAAGHFLTARLRVGGQTAALEMGTLRNRRYWSLVQSYDLRFSRHAPGRLLFWRLLEQCPGLGIDLFDFLAPAHRHKLEWSNGETGIADYLVPVSIKGRLAVSYLSNIKPILRDLYVQLPPSLRRGAAGLVQELS